MTYRIDSAAGPLLVAFDRGGRLERVAFATDTPAEEPGAPAPSPVPPSSSALLGPLLAWLDDWAAGRTPSFDALPLAPLERPLDAHVRAAMLAIPYGETRSYGEVAAWIGRPRAARAVGAACGRNPVALLVPCHRVVARDGLGGFSGPDGMKQRLLAHEARHVPLPLLLPCSTDGDSHAGW